jgi:RNA polymerase sigma factor (sigma-70 family)
MPTTEAEVFCRRVWPRLVGSMTLYCGDRAVAEEMSEAPVTVDEGADDAGRLAVRAAVSGLPARQRMAVVLRFYADLPVWQVAQLMGCAEATVRVHTFKAVAALRQQGLVDVEEDADHARSW